MKARPIGSVRAFNSGRQYSRHGQRIAVQAWELADGTFAVLMYDIDRGLDYALPADDERDALRMACLDRAVMAAYDAGGARHISAYLLSDDYVEGIDAQNTVLNTLHTAALRLPASRNLA